MKTFILNTEMKDGMLSIKSINNGFEALELLGILEWKKQDVLKQMTGEIKPDIVERNVVKEADYD